MTSRLKAGTDVFVAIGTNPIFIGNFFFAIWTCFHNANIILHEAMIEKGRRKQFRLTGNKKRMDYVLK